MCRSRRHVTATDPVFVHKEMLEAEARQPANAVAALQHGNRRDRTRYQASFSHHAYSREAVAGPARGRIEDVTIAPPIDRHVALVVAAAGERAVIDRNVHNAGLRVSRVSDADIPRLEIWMRTDHSNIAPEVD